MAKAVNTVVVQAPAKLNLALAVTGLRPDGYHCVDMVMQAVSVWERVELSRSSGYTLRLPGSPVPVGENNTATRAAKVFFTQLGLLAGADITIHKTVPTRAGMAGGSADAAAVLVGLNALYGARLSLGELCKLGLMVGADVPFALMGGTARVSGIGEQLYPLPPLPGCWFAIAMPPGGGTSTPAAYRCFDELGSPLRPDVAAACAAIWAGSLAGLAPHMQNMLQHAAGGKHTAALCRLFSEWGALAAMMTGSGAAVFGLFLEKQAAQRAAAAAGPLANATFVAAPVAGGPRLVQQP